MYDIQYFVNKEKGVVVCHIFDVAETVVDDMIRHGIGPANEETLLSSLLKPSYVGKARCSANDTFDEELGKKIAYKRAIFKINRAKEKVIKRIIRDQEKYHRMFMETVNALEKRYTRIAANVEKDCKELIGEDTTTDNVARKPHITEGET